MFDKPAKAGAKGAPESIIIGNFTLTAQLPNGRSMNVAGYLYEGEGLASINERLDLCQEAIERQRTRCEIPELEARRDQHVLALQSCTEVIGELEQKARAGHLSSQERMNLQNQKTTIKKINDEIEKGTTAIAEAKKKVGVR